MNANIKITQADRLLRHLNDYGKITSLEAFQEYGITRISAVIYTLRHKHGYNISTTMIESLNRYNEPVRYGVYELEESL